MRLPLEERVAGQAPADRRQELRRGDGEALEQRPDHVIDHSAASREKKRRGVERGDGEQGEGGPLPGAG